MSDCWMPSVCATTARPAAGVWLGAQISILPSFQCATQLFGLERRVRDERVHVGGFDDLGRPGQRLVHVAVLAQDLLGGALAQLVGLAPGSPRWSATTSGATPTSPSAWCGPTAPATSCRRRSPRPAPPPCRLVPPSSTKACFTPGSALISSRFALATLAPNTGAFSYTAHSMPGSVKSMLNTGLPVTMFSRVHALHRLADDRVVLRVLQRHHRQHRHRQLGGGFGHLAVAHRLVAGAVHHAARRRGALGRGHAHLLRGGGDDHLADGGADLAARIPVRGRRGAAARHLRAVLGLVHVGLFDGDAAPLHVQLVGDDHRQHVLDALTDLRVLRRDGHRAVGRDLHERQRHRTSAAWPCGGPCANSSSASKCSANTAPPPAMAVARRNERRFKVGSSWPPSYSAPARGRLRRPRRLRCSTARCTACVMRR